MSALHPQTIPPDVRRRVPVEGGSWLPVVSAQMLIAAGYVDIRMVGTQLCALKRFNFTTAVFVGLDEVGYQRRYCYEHTADARSALQAWDGSDHPPGPWIKCKGAGIDLLDPHFR